MPRTTTTQQPEDAQSAHARCRARQAGEGSDTHNARLYYIDSLVNAFPEETEAFYETGMNVQNILRVYQERMQNIRDFIIQISPNNPVATNIYNDLNQLIQERRNVVRRRDEEQALFQAEGHDDAEEGAVQIMGQFKGMVKGAGGTASRLGTKVSGLVADVTGFNAGIKIKAEHLAGHSMDVIKVFVTTGTNENNTRREMYLGYASGAGHFSLNNQLNTSEISTSPSDAVLIKLLKELRHYCEIQLKKKERWESHFLPTIDEVIKGFEGISDD